MVMCGAFSRSFKGGIQVPALRLMDGAQRRALGAAQALMLVPVVPPVQAP